MQGGAREVRGRRRQRKIKPGERQPTMADALKVLKISCAGVRPAFCSSHSPIVFVFRRHVSRTKSGTGTSVPLYKKNQNDKRVMEKEVPMVFSPRSFLRKNPPATVYTRRGTKDGEGKRKGQVRKVSHLTRFLSRVSCCRTRGQATALKASAFVWPESTSFFAFSTRSFWVVFPKSNITLVNEAPKYIPLLFTVPRAQKKKS